MDERPKNTHNELRSIRLRRRRIDRALNYAAWQGESPLRFQSSREAQGSHFTRPCWGAASGFGGVRLRVARLLVAFHTVVRMPPCGRDVPPAVSPAQKADRGRRLRCGAFDLCVNHRGTTRVGPGRSSPRPTRSVPYRRGRSSPRSTSGNGVPTSRRRRGRGVPIGRRY